MNFTGMPPGMTPEMLAEILGIGGRPTVQSAPRPDTNYSSGFDYARSIAGGIPASQMIAPGVSYSQDQPSGYTQQDLNMISSGPAPMMPIAPGTGDNATIDDQMSFAPPGVTQPTPFSAGGNFDFLTGLDFSNLPDFSNIDIDSILKEYSDRTAAGEPEPITSFFQNESPVMPSFPIQQPMNFTGLPSTPASSFMQPKVEDIVSSIRTGSPRRQQQPGLFNSR